LRADLAGGAGARASFLAGGIETSSSCAPPFAAGFAVPFALPPPFDTADFLAAITPIPLRYRLLALSTGRDRAEESGRPD
jgi:hypothetical protein